ncbi:MAG: hypothetical protein DLM65_07495, partial [Candidatus Aeolococcus gillhamiae]
MSATRLIARPMLSSMFIFGGIDAVRNPDGKVPKAEKVTGPLTDMVPSLPKDTATLVRINGAVQIGAGVALATGKFRRLAAVALIGSTVPTTLAGHRFWEEEDPEQRAQQQVHFLKNIGLLGGLILAAVDTEGAPSLTWRAKRGAKRTSQAVSLGLESSTALVAKGRGRAARLRARLVAFLAAFAAALLAFLAARPRP